MKNPRLIIAIISTIIEEGVIGLLLLYGFPRIGVKTPLWLMIVIMVLWLGYSVYIFRKGSKALSLKQVKGLADMTGTTGKVVSKLEPEGMVKIEGELWSAISMSGRIERGENITVTGQDRLKLEVKRSSEIDSSGQRN